MTLLKLKTVPFILIEDEADHNTIPLLSELIQPTKNSVKVFCFEYPTLLWRTVFKDQKDTEYYDEIELKELDKYVPNKSIVIVDSIFQMALTLGWCKSLKLIKQLNAHENVVQLIIILHKDCLKSTCKYQSHLNHLANAILTYGKGSCNKISVVIKKSGKVYRSNEYLDYDARASCLKLIPITDNKIIENNEPVQINPSKLSTFKIEVAQLEMLENNKLELPYMSKINYGESKVYYEPDAVDDWDEEDPDDDLDI